MGYNSNLNLYITHTKSDISNVFRATAVGRVAENGDGTYVLIVGVSLAHPEDEFIKEFGIKNAIMALEEKPLVKLLNKKPTGKEIVLTIQNIAQNVVIRAYTNQRPFIKL
jgi:hypothetical protein